MGARPWYFRGDVCAGRRIERNAGKYHVTHHRGCWWQFITPVRRSLAVNGVGVQIGWRDACQGIHSGAGNPLGSTAGPSACYNAGLSRPGPRDPWTFPPRDPRSPGLSRVATAGRRVLPSASAHYHLVIDGRMPGRQAAASAGGRRRAVVVVYRPQTVREAVGWPERLQGSPAAGLDRAGQAGWSASRPSFRSDFITAVRWTPENTRECRVRDRPAASRRVPNTPTGGAGRGRHWQPITGSAARPLIIRPMPGCEPAAGPAPLALMVSLTPPPAGTCGPVDLVPRRNSWSPWCCDWVMGSV